MASGDSKEDGYKPRDAINVGLQGTLMGATLGLFTASVVNALRKRNVGIMGPFTKSGQLIYLYALGAGSLSFTQSCAANLRQKDDHWNWAIAGFPAGAVLVMPTMKLSAILGVGAFVSVFMGTFAYTGGTLAGWKETDEEAYERKMKLRNTRRRPIEETIAQLGEGRGIYPPGYEERRRQLLKEKYGYEVNPVKATVDGST